MLRVGGRVVHEYLHAMCDDLIVSSSSSRFLHHFITYERYCFWIIELNPSGFSLAGKFSKSKYSKSIQLFGC